MGNVFGRITFNFINFTILRFPFSRTMKWSKLEWQCWNIFRFWLIQLSRNTKIMCKCIWIMMCLNKRLKDSWKLVNKSHNLIMWVLSKNHYSSKNPKESVKLCILNLIFKPLSPFMTLKKIQEKYLKILSEKIVKNISEG
jgi:hypothetical protein